MSKSTTYGFDMPNGTGMPPGNSPRASLEAMLRDYDNTINENKRLKQSNKEKEDTIMQLKAKLQFSKELILSTIQMSSSPDADKKNTCELIQAFFDSEVLPQKKGSKGKRSEAFNKTNETFTVAIDDNETRNKTLIRAYNDCKKYKLIAEDTVEKDFIDIFSGVRTDATIKWVSGTGSLYYFFNRLKEKEAINTPAGYGIWEVVKSHFVNKNGKVFTQDLSSQKPPQKKDLVANIMDIVSTMGLGY